MNFLLIKYKIKHDKIDDFMKFSNAYIEETRKELLNLSLEYGKIKDKDEFFFNYRWADKNSYFEHKKTAHFKKFAAEITDCLNGNFVPYLLNSIY